MGLAPKLKQYLEDNGIAYDTTEHRKTSSSESTADASHIAALSLAKGVVVKGEGGYLLVVLPASHTVQLDELGTWLKQPVELASEHEIAGLFPDCELGAIPPIGGAYGLHSVVDTSLDTQDDVYFEGGDHHTLVHVSKAEFGRLMEKVPHDRFTAPAQSTPV